MVLTGETLLTGAQRMCPDCQITVDVKVCRSNAGWYIGSECKCGPYSRESKYYPSYEEAEMMLELWKDGNYLDSRYSGRGIG